MDDARPIFQNTENIQKLQITFQRIKPIVSVLKVLMKKFEITQNDPL